jgi:hypothetical protein
MAFLLLFTSVSGVCRSRSGLFQTALRQTEELPPAGFLNRQNLTKEERG